jgi:hypothetical protein
MSMNVLVYKDIITEKENATNKNTKMEQFAQQSFGKYRLIQ